MGPDETREELGLGLSVLQKKGGFRFGVDAVVLAKFAAPFAAGRTVDLGTGCGIVPLLLWAYAAPEESYGLELQRDYAEMALRSASENGLTGRVHFLQGDLRDPPAELAPGSFDLVTANPPYQKVGEGLPPPREDRRIARTECCATLEDVTAAAARLLRRGGRFCLVHRPERLAEALALFARYHLQPDRLRFVQASETAAPSLFLLSGVLFGSGALTAEPAILLDRPDRPGQTNTEQRG